MISIFKSILAFSFRTGASGNALRIEQAIYCHQEGVSNTGCPIAKEV
jgi:hypothetical protein